MKYRTLIGGIIAYILLALYSGIAGYIIYLVVSSYINAEPFPKDLVNGGMVYVLTTVGGLVSALVISKLTITKPGDDPTVFEATKTLKTSQKNIVKIIVWFYLFVWMLVGLSALLVGVIFFPDQSGTLSDLGTNWLGIAVAAGYAYLGLDPKK